MDSSTVAWSLCTLGACEVCDGEGRVYACIGRDIETGSAIEASAACDACEGSGVVPVLAGFEPDEEPPTDDAPDHDPADAPLFVAPAPQPSRLAHTILIAARAARARGALAVTAADLRDAARVTREARS